MPISRLIWKVVSNPVNFLVPLKWQRSDGTGSMLLGQTVHKIKSMLFLVVKQDSCVGAEKKKWWKAVWEERTLREKEWEKSSQSVFLWSFMCKETPGIMNLYHIAVLASSTITLFLLLSIFLFTVMLWLVVSTWCLWIKSLLFSKEFIHNLNF